jgi:oligopeptide/dipeptide ABC transporter ATP-binding protein
MSLLAIESLRVSFPMGGGNIPIVGGVNLSVNEGEVLGVAGESGSGKTISAMAIMGLLPPEATISGSIRFGGRELLGLSESEMRRIRGNEISMVFQDPLSSLHPMITIGNQLTDHLRAHQKVSKAQARSRALELLDLVRLPNPTKTLNVYPHQLSGGMRQRVAIAIALACSPKLLIADEPTTALDVTVQAGIIDLLKNLARDLGLAVMIVTHDLGVLSSIADRLAVFYAGSIVETSRTSAVFRNPTHPYTEALLRAIPHRSNDGQITLRPMTGVPPAAGEWPRGCQFAPRCSYAVDACATDRPALSMPAPEHAVACHVKGTTP